MFEMVPFDYRARRVLPNDFFGMDEFFSAPFRTAGAFRTDVIDNGDAYELDAELPGMEKENIQLRVEDNTLVISAEQKTENDAQEANYLRRERTVSSYSRSFSLEGIDADNITASYVNGILKLNLPKQKPEAPEARYIAIA